MCVCVCVCVCMCVCEDTGEWKGEHNSLDNQSYTAPTSLCSLVSKRDCEQGRPSICNISALH